VHALAEEKLTQEVDTDGWDDLGDVFAFRYLPEDGAPEDGLQVHVAMWSSFLPLLHMRCVGACHNAVCYDGQRMSQATTA
jgi:hypothetical protein